MGKFKVGDRVRRITDSINSAKYGVKGEVYTVLAVEGDHPVVIDGARSASDHAFELVSPVWVPKVGDRVARRHSETTVDIEKHWDACFRQSNGEIIDGALVVASFDGRLVGLSNKVGRSFFYMPVDSLQPAPPTLTIEPGRYYKTRDGRKVGPMEKGEQWPQGPWFFKFGDNHFEKSGKSCFGGNGSANRPTDDLIAEWQEPAVVPSAQVDALAEEYGPAKVAASNDNGPKFKVGDRVRVVGARLNHKKDHVGKEFTIERETYMVRDEKTWTGDGGGGYVWLASELELVPPTTPAIVALIENGTPLPATKPKVHADQTAATKEAERLALANPGQEFGVFVLADRKIADVVTTKTTVLRAA